VAIKPKVKKKEQEVIEPEEVGNVEVSEEFNSQLKGENINPTFTVKLDSKKLENRDVQQAVALVQGALGSVKKVIIEKE
jgi:hypothetical protein